LGEFFSLPKINQPRKSNPHHPPQEDQQTSPPLITFPPEEPTKTIPLPQEETHQPNPLPPSTHQPTWAKNLIKIIKIMTASPCNLPSAPEFLFTFGLESAEKNYIILRKRHPGSLQRALDANRDSPLGRGSEFRKIPTIKHFFQHHPI
jgi:hypothetical protein